MLGGDYSEEKQDEVAEHFSVSPMTIQAQLVNHGRINQEDAPDHFWPWRRRPVAPLGC